MWYVRYQPMLPASNGYSFLSELGRSPVVQIGAQ
jgi:hypothetical protein